MSRFSGYREPPNGNESIGQTIEIRKDSLPPAVIDFLKSRYDDVGSTIGKLSGIEDIEDAVKIKDVGRGCTQYELILRVSSDSYNIGKKRRVGIHIGPAVAIDRLRCVLVYDPDKDALEMIKEEKLDSKVNLKKYFITD